MFEQSLFEVSPEMRKRKRLTALLSYSLEALAVVVIISFPLLHTQALPLDDSPKFRPPVRYSPPHVDIVSTTPPPPTAHNQQVPINPLLPPREIGKTIDRTPDPTPPAYSGPSTGSDLDGLNISDPRAQNPVISEMLKPPPIKPVPHAVLPRISTSMESMLIRRVTPVYPPIAVASRIQGTVVIQAVINRQGEIEKMQLISGHPLLVNSALAAVKQWKYRPYLLNGEPVDVDTRITVNFTLNQQ